MVILLLLGILSAGEMFADQFGKPMCLCDMWKQSARSKILAAASGQLRLQSIDGRCRALAFAFRVNE